VNLIRSSAGPVAGATGGRDNLIFLIAGEPSGDMLGARLMAALKRQSAGAIRSVIRSNVDRSNWLASQAMIPLGDSFLRVWKSLADFVLI